MASETEHRSCTLSCAQQSRTASHVMDNIPVVCKRLVSFLRFGFVDLWQIRVLFLQNSCLITHLHLSSWLSISKKVFACCLSLQTIAEKEYLFAWRHHHVPQANEVRESVLFSLWKERTSGSYVLILKHMELENTSTTHSLFKFCAHISGLQQELLQVTDSNQENIAMVSHHPDL